ncbi:hypothetical protein Tcan_08906 [Toxocara canis]|uniref:Uncharacterized protein n=1 Tax=Toxocara canis TaxID=6265 RepID=A0A0B2W398_TOXCA|nr:hypothetical protein Tcan_08906 [Toxocara canis]
MYIPLGLSLIVKDVCAEVETFTEELARLNSSDVINFMMIGLGMGSVISMFLIVFICQLIRGPQYACDHLDYFPIPTISDSKGGGVASASSSTEAKQSAPSTAGKKDNQAPQATAEKPAQAS